MSFGLTTGMGDLKQFIIDNNIVGTSAGVCVALAAKDGIQSLVGDVIIPAIVLFLHTLHIDFLTKYLPVTGKSQINITDFVKQFITFLLIILISFLFVKVAFGYLLGVGYTKSMQSGASAANTTNNTNTALASQAALDTKTVSAVVSASSSGKEKFANIFDNFDPF